MVIKFMEKCKDLRFVNRCICWLLLLCMCSVCCLHFCSRSSICLSAHQDVSKSTSFERFLGAPAYYRNNELLLEESYELEEYRILADIMRLNLFSMLPTDFPAHSYIALSIKSWVLRYVFDIHTRVEGIALELFTVEDVATDLHYAADIDFYMDPPSEWDFWKEHRGCYIRSDTFEGDTVRKDIRDGIIHGSEESE